ncbi:putative U-box domain-containing protein 42 [Phragmites australis]|uniref:putative U-box domain-containing protein 42 n=1 Tax=Phragmites australis TaxID=29695 RepID=UPI002D77591C|nr:putative U-box domain-containing protein 42 [Phragmites australis]
MQRSEAQARKASLAESVLAAISELMSSAAAVEVEQEKFMDVGSRIHHADPVTMDLQRSQNSPINTTHIMEYLAANVGLAKDLVARCSAFAQQLMDDDLLSITEDLNNVIKNISNELGRLPTSSFVSSTFAEPAISGRVQVVRNQQDLYDQLSCDGYSEAELSMVVANDRPRRRKLHDSDMPRLVDFLHGMYQESHESGGQSFSSLPEVAEYVEPLYDSFFCPLTNKVMVDPVTTESGVTYDRRAIEGYFEKFTDGTEPLICPVTKMAMQSKTLRSNVPLKSTIAEWITRNEATRVRIARTALSMATTEAMVLEAIHELKVLARLRRKNRDQMHKIGITKFLARLLDHKDALIRCDSLDLLCLLVEDNAGKEIIAKTRSVSRTIKLLSSSSPDERHAAISFLVELSKSELLLENIGSTAGSILILITMKFNGSDDPVAAEKAGEVLKNLEKCPKNIKYMAESGYLDPLQRHLVEGSEDVQMEMVSYLGELVQKQDMTINIAGSASEILVKMVCSGNMAIRKAALDVLVQISSHHPNGRTLVDAGAVPVMVEELFIRKIDEEPMGSKTEAAAILANIVESGLDPEAIVVNKEGHVITSKYSVYNFAHMLKSSMPNNLNLSIVRVLLALTALPKPLATVVSVMKEQDSSQTVIEFMGSLTEALGIAATRLLIALSPQMGHTIAEKLCKAPGQPGKLIKSIGQPGRITERHAVSTILLARLPYQHIALNLALLNRGAMATVLAKIEEMQRGDLRASRHAKAYMEGLVGALVRLTTTLYDQDVLLAAMDHSFTSVLTDLLVRSAGSDEVQRLAAVGLENLSSQSPNLSQQPTEERLPKRKNILQRLRDAHSSRVYDNRKPPAHNRVCPVHRGVCSPATTFCLVEAGAVEALLGVLESNENGRVVEAALGALCTLMDDAVDVTSGVAVLAEHDAARHVLRALRQHRDGGGGAVARRCFWAVERFLAHGGERCVRVVKGDRALPSLLVSAFHKGDAATKQVAESVLRCLHRMPDYSATYESIEL